ncbi:MAG TPA: cyanophycinase [Thermoanaerobaculia bacterium]|nr:cyanophycinase [Thermoanaerobaculia bacterium]
MAAKKTTKRAPTVKDIAPKGKGTLVIVGGHEDKEGDKKILQLIADQAKGKKLVVATVATAEPEETWQEYRALFTELGVQTIEHLDVQTREQALSEECSRYLADAAAVFFTGGDQLKITSQLGDSMVYRQLHLILERGGTVAGTSAGASVMSTTMLISGPGDQSPEVQDAIRMAPGFGFLPDAVIDQHFAERGRVGRLLAAIAQNPRLLGIGIDEDTAILVHGNEQFEVVGNGSVYVLDASQVSYSNLTETELEARLTTFDVKLHLLSEGYRYDLQNRRPCMPAPKDKVQKNGSK